MPADLNLKPYILKANVDIATFWNQQPLAAGEYASSTIIPTCLVVVDNSNAAKYLIDKEALLGSMGANGSTGPEAVAAVEKNAALLTARAGSRDLSAIPSIYCVSPALECAAAGLTSAYSFLVAKDSLALLGSMGANGSTRPEAVAAVEKNAALLTASAGSRDLSAIPSVRRVSPALPYAVDLLCLQLDAFVPLTANCSIGFLQITLCAASPDRCWHCRSQSDSFLTCRTLRKNPSGLWLREMLTSAGAREMVSMQYRDLFTEFKRITSPLKYQRRCVAAFPDQQVDRQGSKKGNFPVLVSHKCWESLGNVLVVLFKNEVCETWIKARFLSD
nr:augmin subunit 5 [Quercus suber]